MAERFALDETISLLGDHNETVSLPDHSSPVRNRVARIENAPIQQRTIHRNDLRSFHDNRDTVTVDEVQRMIDANSRQLSLQIEQLTALVRTVADRGMTSRGEESVFPNRRNVDTRSDRFHTRYEKIREI